MNQTITLPIEVVERALASLESEFGKHSKSASDIRAALEQPQNHVPNAGNMVPAGWKLVPVEPTQAMIDQMRLGWSDISTAYIVDRWRRAVAAAPQPPTTEGSSEVQAQVEQEPVSWIENFEGSISYGPIHEAARKLPEGARFDLYTHPQPKREQLTDEQIAAATGGETWNTHVAGCSCVRPSHRARPRDRG